MYAEKCPAFRRRKLFEMLDLADGRAPPQTTPRQPDLAFTLNGGFGLSYSFNNKRSCRKIDPNRFSSAHINDNAIFGYKQMSFNSTTAPRAINTASPGGRGKAQIHLIVTRLSKPEKMANLVEIADDYSSIWIELSKEIDSKSRNVGTRKLANSQAIFPISTPFSTSTEIMESTRSIAEPAAPRDCETPRRRNKMSYSLRLNDNTLRDLYKSDSRWSPKVTRPL
ncbi:hypothetical protein TRFO_01805 [Tritrichomonas foetus]|uniref:Uncharacterized protein n=1 Tax=Tritrichomonas foetus TaxID=1144522 RepID=A0A1J4JK58_9EUKA|nr:hypothetical protein TRFO_01805 [Tritrichomonas foetus]|eukprot:OHS98767.1 hypothetical protein TRFO_01805 [Tritrichomonas foetus]